MTWSWSRSFSRAFVAGVAIVPLEASPSVIRFRSGLSQRDETNDTCGLQKASRVPSILVPGSSGFPLRQDSPLLGDAAPASPARARREAPRMIEPPFFPRPERKWVRVKPAARRTGPPFGSASEAEPKTEPRD